MAAGNSLTLAIVNQQIANVAADQKRKYYRWRQWSDYYSVNFGTDQQLQDGGIGAAGDRTKALNLILDLGRMASRFGGNAPAFTTINYLQDAQLVNAWRHSASILQQELAGVAFEFLDHYYWWLSTYDQWNTNAQSGVLTGLGFSGGDATTITNIISDLNTLANDFINQNESGSINMLARCEAVLAVS